MTKCNLRAISSIELLGSKTHCLAASSSKEKLKKNVNGSSEQGLWKMGTPVHPQANDLSFSQTSWGVKEEQAFQQRLRVRNAFAT